MNNKELILNFLEFVEEKGYSLKIQEDDWDWGSDGEEYRVTRCYDIAEDQLSNFIKDFLKTIKKRV